MIDAEFMLHLYLIKFVEWNNKILKRLTIISKELNVVKNIGFFVNGFSKEVKLNERINFNCLLKLLTLIEVENIA